MKKFNLFILLLVCCASLTFAQQAKYVFYFIGDGMGLNQVNATESYLAELQGRIGIEPLCFPSFPQTTYATSYSASNGITDSAAGGTALATGVKTYNGALGVTTDTVRVSSVAEWAKQKGVRVGVSTTVSIDHATPASFYAHVASRKSYNLIGHDLIASDFDYFAGSDFLEPINKKKANDKDLHLLCQEAGYTFAYGYNEAQNQWKKADKLILLQTKEAAKQNTASLPYAIDRKQGDLRLAEIVDMGIHFLNKDAKKGFFFMIEGGKIDQACHANDAATSIQETIDLDEAVKVAYAFYKQHPKETLIVVTADHETGGMGLGNGKYEQHLQVLQHQTVSTALCTEALNQLRKSKTQVTWEDAKQVLSQSYGLYTKVNVNEKQDTKLRKAFSQTFGSAEGATDKSLYQNDARLATEGRIVLNEIAMISWASGTHSNAYVPVYAIGAGAELFHGRMNNTDIPNKIAQAAGYKH